MLNRLNLNLRQILIQVLTIARHLYIQASITPEIVSFTERQNLVLENIMKEVNVSGNLKSVSVLQGKSVILNTFADNLELQGRVEIRWAARGTFASMFVDNLVM